MKAKPFASRAVGFWLRPMRTRVVVESQFWDRALDALVSCIAAIKGRSLHLLQFIYSTRSLPPFPVDKFPDRPSNHQKEWILKDQHPSRDFQGYTCQDILTSFIRTVKWAKRNHDVNFFPDGVQMQVNSLHIFHYKGHTGGIKFRAQLPHAAQIQTFCEKNLPYRKNLKIPIPHFSSLN